MKSLSVVLSFIFVITAFATGDVQAFCSQWFSGNVANCIEQATGSPTVDENLNVVNNRLDSGDKSVCLSYYLHYPHVFYEQNMIMQSDPLPIYSGSSTGSSCDINPVNRTYAKLASLSIPDNVNRFVTYRYAAALDLLFIRFKQQIPSFDVTFSLDMLTTLLGENASAVEVMTFLRDKGVCSKEDYENEVQAGRGGHPQCCVYRLRSFTPIRKRNSCELAQEILNKDLYAEFALNPYSLQLHCSSSIAPISHSYYRYTVAGVITGFQVTSDYKYWTVYIRRHGANNNIVKVKLDWARTFGAVNGHVYDLEADVNSVTTRTEMNYDRCYEYSVPTATPTTQAPITQTPTTQAPATTTPPSPYYNEMYNNCGSDFVNSWFATGSVPVIASNINDIKNKKNVITHIYVADNTWNGNSAAFNLKNDKLPNLLYICIGSNAMKTSSPFAVDGKEASISKSRIPKLKGIYVGSYSLTQSTENQRPTRRSEKKFEVKELPSLEEVIIGRGSFGDFTDFDMEDLPSLKTLKIGVIENSTSYHSDNFYWVDDLSFDDINSNAQITIGNYAFHETDDDEKEEFTDHHRSRTTFGYGTFQG